MFYDACYDAHPAIIYYEGLKAYVRQEDHYDYS